MRRQHTSKARAFPERNREGEARGLRRVLRRLAPALLAAPLLFTASAARAQTDISPPLPDFLLLVDTSGSMEYKIGTSTFPACFPDGSQLSEKSRWTNLLEVLTGEIQNYRCQSIDRTASSFATGEYALPGSSGSVPPYDYLYEDPYHRPMSGTCVMGPGTLTSNVFDFSDTAIKLHDFSSTNIACSSTFAQAQDGILDSYAHLARFGLMTFDTLSDPSTGINGTSSPDYAGGVKGTWSYIVGNPTQGKPANCNTLQPFDVGARNAAAPPWEGRLVAFGDPNPGSTAYLTKNAQIQQVLLASRPFGATPIAGMLHDAEDFLINDKSKDPLNSALDFGPSTDPYVVGGCRDRFIILLTDGQPNMDLRPDCGDQPNCPFKNPEDIARDLVTLPQPIETFVIGFALSQFTVNGTTIQCKDLTSQDLDTTNTGGLCGSSSSANKNNQALQACCALNRIALKGSPNMDRQAFFANTSEDLAGALSSILSSVLPVTSRTQPVSSGALAGASGFRFFSSAVPKHLQPWAGILTAQQYGCDNNNNPAPAPGQQPEDFAAEVNRFPQQRQFVSIQAGTGSDPVHSERTIRPLYTTSGAGDGAGVYSGTRYMGTQSAFVSQTSADMIQVTDTTCVDSTTGNFISANLCRDRYLKWLVGLDNGTGNTRCPASGGCSLFGDILHSTPRVVGLPSDFLQDESYEAFAQLERTQNRPVVLYTSTNDGFLHAFEVKAESAGSESSTLHELWAFVPPAILPQLRSQYPFTHQALLDGVPVVKDVVASTPTTGAVSDIRFERTHDDAQHGNGAWRTILIQSFGTSSPAGGGYFALDVTTPTLTGSTSDADRGPRFLWQLTTDASGNALFGTTATPYITTLFFDPSLTTKTATEDPQWLNTAKQIAVAILPGGAASADAVGTTDGVSRTFPNIDSRFPPRSTVRAYKTAALPARSLTVVRLDTGEIIRTFRQVDTEVSDTNLRARVNVAPIDSPISGQPVAFPSDTGAVADRAYVGDQDGRVWRANFASANPANWTMDLFFDTFPAQSSVDPSIAYGSKDGQPVALPPVISVDQNGNVTMNVATGDQDTVGASPTTKNYVWSLTEKVTTNSTNPPTTQVNWNQPFQNGERVVGPMVLFNSQLFFTTFAPPQSNAQACDIGSGNVFGMDYLRPAIVGSGPVLNQGGVPVLKKSDGTLVASMPSSQITGSASAVIFGLTVTQQPACTASATTASNDYFGYRSEQAITTINPGKFQLVMQFGDGKKSTTSGGPQANVATVDLPSPPSAARVDSWAALVE